MAVNINVPSQVRTFANLAAFPASGALKTIYIAEDTNKTYRWTGSVYTEISATAASTWGAIGGTLSNQTDLQTALNAKQNSLGYTPVPETRTLTINGTTQDLSADRTFTISTGITIGTTAITSGTVGRVLFEGTGNVVQESANLFWDNTNGRLGIGTSSPSNSLTIKTGVNDDGILLESSVGNPLFLVRKDGTSNSTAELFQYSNGSIRLAIRSASNFSYFNGGNFGFGTTTDAGFRLDVNGTARVQGVFTQTNGSSSSVVLDASTKKITVGQAGSFFNTISFPSAGAFSFFNDNSGQENFRITAGRQIYTNQVVDAFTQTNTLQISGNRYGVSTTLPAIELNTYNTSGSGYNGIRLQAFNGDSGKLVLQPSTGNVLIGTTTDDGYKLDVNGTARVSGNVTVSGNTTITNSFIANSAGTGYEGFKIQDGGTARFVAERLVTNFLGIGHNSSAGRWDDVILGASQRLYFYTGASERARFAATTGNFLIGTTTDAGYKLDVNGTARVSGDFTVTTNIISNQVRTSIIWGEYLNTSNNAFTVFRTTTANGNIRVYNSASIGTTVDPVASAQLEVVSTTKGFLPPRMTTTQKNAIVSPATGLMVYDNVLNRPCFYDGATWITL